MEPHRFASASEFAPLLASRELGAIDIVDQTRLPQSLVTRRLATVLDAADAIRSMQVRGAPLIGVTAAYGLAIALRADPSEHHLRASRALLLATRPTAVNLRWALDDLRGLLAPLPQGKRRDAAYRRAAEISDEDVEICRRIGENGLGLIRKMKPRGDRLNALTHCNAGWLATVDWGTALAPIYQAHDAGLPIHVWVDETRPRNQGASLTAWELGKHGVPHTVIADNAGGHLMQHGRVDLCIVGTDRTTAEGDVCNKIGTYLKALAAHDTGVPFYVAAPSPSIDWTIARGADIPIEERSAAEVRRIAGQRDGAIAEVELVPATTPVANPAFDVTPARLVTGKTRHCGTPEAPDECGHLPCFETRQLRYR
jgi:methylthioribose-1-phosphate isomerase